MANNSQEVFPLSPKYIDFMKHEASAEFLEGTTFAGKTTVAIPKFMTKVMLSPKKSIISGLDLGTIQKNIVTKDHGILEIYGDYEKGGMIEQNTNGTKEDSLPHLIFHTPYRNKNNIPNRL